MSLLTDPTLEMTDDTAEMPLDWSPSPIARPVPLGRDGQVRRRPRTSRRGRRRVVHLATGGGISAAAATLAWAWPTAEPALRYGLGLLS